MRVAAQVTLTASERRRLETWASARSTAVRLVERSKIILMACAGMTNQAIAHALGIDQNTVGRWRNRFVKEGAKGIEKERPPTRALNRCFTQDTTLVARSTRSPRFANRWCVR